MKSHEVTFLALVALGHYRVDLETGTIWRALNRGREVEAPVSVEEQHHKGYRTVKFSPGDGTRLKVYVHRIVWAVFNKRLIGKDKFINHKDGNKGNNHPSNLEEVTPSENDKHRFHVLGKSVPRRSNGRFHRPEEEPSWQSAS